MILPAPTYADLADLSDQTPLVIKAQVRKVIALEPARAAGVRPGWARVYIEARTEALIAGNRGLGEQLSYLADLRLDPRGKLPSLKKKSVILFARPVAGRPAELQLVAPDAQLAWDAALETRIKAILAELYAPGAPQKVTGVREALHVPGNLADAGETQIFLATASGEPSALTVARSPGGPPRFSASFSEVVGDSGGLPARDTLAWYRLACFLPQQLPARANISDSVEDRAAAARDYRAAISQLGPCERTRS
ncbi:MAG: hypothetical protein JSR96_07065 [Proteobacteria bacterium]|nr:hypothetical protein [Pseudomonadota bacterium]